MTRRFLVLLALAIVTGKTVNGCPQNFARVGNDCTLSIVLYGAQLCDIVDRNCKNQGGNVIMVKNSSVYQSLLNPNQTNITSAAEIGLTNPNLTYVMGLKYKADNKTWQWSDGTIYNPSTDWSIWINGTVPEPKQDANVILRRVGDDFKWDLFDCSKPYSVRTICYAREMDTEPNCPDHYSQSKADCLLSVGTNVSANRGAEICAARGNGSLVTTKTYNDFYNSVYYYAFPNGDGFSRMVIQSPIWIGLKYKFNENKWKWIDGTEYNISSDWGLWQKKPAPPKRDVCVQVIYSENCFGSGHCWITEDCDAEKGRVICSKPADLNADEFQQMVNPYMPPFKVPMVNGCPQQYVRVGITCMYISSAYLSIMDADRQCKYQGGYLPMTKNENDFKRVLNISMELGATDFAIGLRYSFAEKKWRWSDNTIYNPRTDWSMWANNTVLDETKGDVCVYLQVAGNGSKWFPASCYLSLRLMCYAPATTNESNCPDYYVQEGSRCRMRYALGYMTANNVTKFCAERGNGSLALVKTLKDYQGINVGTWIGIKYFANENKWKYSDGTMHQMGTDWGVWKWQNMPPMTSTKDLCVIILQEDWLTYWNATDCDKLTGTVVCTKRSLDADKIEAVSNVSGKPDKSEMNAPIANGCPMHFSRVGMECVQVWFSQMYVSYHRRNANSYGGSILLNVKTEADYQRLLNPKYFHLEVFPINIYTGLSFTISDRQWHWSDGTIYNPATDWSMWNGKTPAQPTKDVCVAWRKVGNTAKWAIMDCTSNGFGLYYSRAVTKASRCPDFYIQEGYLCIFPILKPDSSAISAKQECMDNDNGTLGMSKTKEEFDLVFSQARSMMDEIPMSLWLGLQYVASESKWGWSDGTEYKMGQDWGLWNPDNPPPLKSDVDLCVQIYKNSQDYQWQTTDCDQPNGLAVCMQPLLDPSKMKEASMPTNAPSSLTNGSSTLGNVSANAKSQTIASTALPTTNTTTVTVKEPTVNGCPQFFVRVGTDCTYSTTAYGYGSSPCNSANQICKDRGSIVFMVKNNETYHRLIKSQMNSTSSVETTFNNPNYTYLMGLQYKAKDKTWLWSDGSAYNPLTDWSMWINGTVPEPTQDINVILRRVGNEYKWDLFNCFEQYSVRTVCYARDTTTAPACPNHYLQTRNLCVLPVSANTSADHGTKICTAHGNGSLLTFKEEADFAYFAYGNSLLDGQAIYTILKQGPLCPLWIGLKYVYNENKWKWQDGSEYKAGRGWDLWRPLPPAPTRDTCVQLIYSSNCSGICWTTEACDAETGRAICSKPANISADEFQRLVNPYTAPLKTPIVNGCPKGFSHVGLDCLKLLASSSTAGYADGQCKNQGGFLLMTKNESDYKRLLPKAQLYGKENGYRDIFLGLKYSVAEKKWRWSDNTVYDPSTDWSMFYNNTAPTASGLNDQCVLLRQIGNNTIWGAVECSNYFDANLICYAPATTNESSCPETYMQDGPRCQLPILQYYKDADSANNGTNICRERGNGYLALVKSPEDYQALLLAGDGQVQKYGYNYPIWIGIRYVQSLQKWIYSDGSDYRIDTDWGVWDWQRLPPAKPQTDLCVRMIRDDWLIYWETVKCDTEVAWVVCTKRSLDADKIEETANTGTPTVNVQMSNGCPQQFARIGQECLQLNFSPEDAAYHKRNAHGWMGSIVLNVKTKDDYERLLNPLFLQLSTLPMNTLSGLSYKIEDRHWRWSDGSIYNPATDWSMWLSGKPPATPTKDTCVFWRSGGKEAKWDATSCTSTGLSVYYSKAITSASKCPPYYIQQGLLCLMPIYKMDSSANSAAVDCANRSNGYLAAVKTPQEYNSVISFAGEMLDQMAMSAWIGLKYVASEGKWKWSDGSEYKMKSDWGLWTLDNPPPLKPESDLCVQMHKSDSGYQWQTEDCDQPSAIAMCSQPLLNDKKPDVLISSASTSATESNCPNQYGQFGSRCQSSFGLSVSYNNITKTCASYDNAYVTLEKSPEDYLALYFTPRISPIWVGLKYVASENKWRWSDGSEHNLYTDWGMWHWQQLPPSNATTDVCIQQINDDWLTYWKAVSCDNSQLGYGICAKRALNADQVEATRKYDGEPPSNGVSFEWVSKLIINGCPIWFMRIGTECVMLNFNQRTPVNHARNCHGYGGSILLNVKTENDYQRLLNPKYLELSVFPYSVISGLNYTSSDKKWYWSDGTTYNPATDWSMWMGKVPAPTKDACVVWKKSGATAKWDIADCTATGFTLCYSKALTPVSNCPDYYEVVRGFCMLPIYKMDSSAISGEKDCRDRGNGTLVAPKTYDDAVGLLGQILNNVPVKGWIGLKYTATESKWKWSDGSEYKMGSDWGLWDPDNLPPVKPDTDLCVQMYKTDNGYQWQISECDQPNALAVCTHPLLNQKNVTALQTSAIASELSATSPSNKPRVNGCPANFARSGTDCTRFAELQQDWSQQQRDCNARGSVILFVKSEDDYHRLLPNPISMPENFLLGLQYTISDKKWHWSDGTVYNPTTDWSMWKNGTPPAEPAQDACVVWKKIDTPTRIIWDLINCTSPGYAICYARATTTVSNCPDQYTQGGQICVKPFLTLHNSAANIAHDCGNAHLIILKTPQDHANIVSMVTHWMLDRLNIPLWIGLKYISSEGKWKWADGTEYKMGNDWGLWRADIPLPSKPSRDLCVQMSSLNQDRKWLWLTEECTAQTGLVLCTKEANSTVEAVVNGCPKHFERSGAHCARIIYQQMPWIQAKQECLSEGAFLFGVKDNDTYQEFFTSATVPANLLLGLQYTVGDKKWHWSDGTIHNFTTDWKKWFGLAYKQEQPTDACVIWKKKLNQDGVIVFGWAVTNCSTVGLPFCYVTASTPQSNCPKMYTQEGNLCFMATSKMSNSAVIGSKLCEANGNGTLPIVKTQDDLENLKQMSNSTMNQMKSPFWLGLKYIAVESKWKWPDGTEYIAASNGSLWTDTKPAAPTGDACVVMAMNASGGFDWFIEDCGAERALVICSKPAAVAA